MQPRTGGLIRVLLVDDNPNVLSTTRLILLTNEDIEVVGEADDGEKSLEEVQRLRPDVVVMEKAGASNTVLKGAGPDELGRAIRTAAI
jgi:chemotaxis response regulator CheB